MRIAILGLGPWGLCALERLLALIRSQPSLAKNVTLHLIDPAHPGSGIYDVAEPDYLVMNNSCADISLFGKSSDSQLPETALSLYEWASATGYRWNDDRCLITPYGRLVHPQDFLPRRVMAEYLRWCFGNLISGFPSDLTIRLHSASAENIISTEVGTEQVVLSNGNSILVDHVILTFGHVSNLQDRQGLASFLTNPYPLVNKLAVIPPKASVLVSGMGLVAMDVVAELTQGRGGLFIREGMGLRYRPSQGEPVIYLVSRSGLPYWSKFPVCSRFPKRDEPIVATKEALLKIRERAPSGVDFRVDVLPLFFEEMRARYYLQLLAEDDSSDSSGILLSHIQKSASEGFLTQTLDALAARFGPFDAHELFFGPSLDQNTQEDYRNFVLNSIREQTTLKGPELARRAAAETFRILRDEIRTIVEYGRLSLESHRDFHSNIRSLINRLVAGPPAWRFEQMEALFRAGVVKFEFGPNPQIFVPKGETNARIRVRSNYLSTPYEREFDFGVRAHLEDPSVDNSSSALLQNLSSTGRLSQLLFNATTAGSVRIDTEGHPIDSKGCAQSRLWLFGAITEGSRYFTHYIASPTRGIRAYSEIQNCVKSIFKIQQLSH